MSVKSPSDENLSLTLTEMAYRLIRKDILANALIPSSKLRIDEVRQRYGIGMSAVREALSRLVSEGLVTSEQQKGFRVAPMSVEEFGEITELRILLEIEAVRKAIERGDESWESEIVAAYHRLVRMEARVAGGDDQMVPTWEKCNREFHDALVGACGSAWLMRLRRILYDHSERYRQRSFLANLARRDTSYEHQLLRDAALARDGDTAATLIRRHFKTTFELYRAASRDTEAGLLQN
jgi:DNA-binding GntR family transcriptional regulator